MPASPGQIAFGEAGRLNGSTHRRRIRGSGALDRERGAEIQGLTATRMDEKQREPCKEAVHWRDKLLYGPSKECHTFGTKGNYGELLTSVRCLKILELRLTIPQRFAQVSDLSPTGNQAFE